MKKVKVEGEKFKSFQVEAKELTLDERAELNDLIYDGDVKKNFSFWLKVIRLGTFLSDAEIHNYSTNEIISIAGTIIEETNKKKDKK